MPNQRIASISLADLRPIGRAADRDYHRITGYLAAHRSFGPVFASLFAEPEFLRDDDVADWYRNDVTPSAVERTILVADLPPEDQLRVLATISGKLAVIREHAKTLQVQHDPMGDALATATTVPEPLANYAYWIPSASAPEGGAAILVAWGWVNQGGRLEGHDIFGVRPRSVSPAAPPAEPDEGSSSIPPATESKVLESQRAVPASGADVSQRLARFNTSWLLWLLFVLLLLIIGWTLLRACGLSLFPFQVSFCPSAVQTVQADRTRMLTDLARDLQLRLAQRDANCVAERSASPHAPTTPPASIEQRLEDAGAKTGEIQISLAWNGDSDLDLSVVCPDGSIINFEKQQSCGGMLDIDKNASSASASMTPVENVFWPVGEAPSGTYRIRVTLFDRRGERRNEIPFEVRIKNGNDVRTIPGVAGPAVKSLIPVAEFSR